MHQAQNGDNIDVAKPQVVSRVQVLHKVVEAQEMVEYGEYHALVEDLESEADTCDAGRQKVNEQEVQAAHHESDKELRCKPRLQVDKHKAQYESSCQEADRKENASPVLFVFVASAIVDKCTHPALEDRLLPLALSVVVVKQNQGRDDECEDEEHECNFVISSCLFVLGDAFHCFNVK